MKAAIAIATFIALALSSTAHSAPETSTRGLKLRKGSTRAKRAKSAKSAKSAKRTKSGKDKKSKPSNSRDGDDDDDDLQSALYIMTNAEEANSVQMFLRDRDDGMLEYYASFATGGMGGSTAGADEGSLSGPGDPLGSTGSLVVVGEKCLLASNAGSDTVTSFYIDQSGVLIREGIYDSGGDLPMSIGYKKKGGRGYYLVYVLNAGGEGTLAGFLLDGKTCEMEFIPGSEVSLEQEDTRDPPLAVASPSQVGFVPGADWLVVNIKGINGEPGTGTISFFPVNDDGTLGTPNVNDSNGFIPFAFTFDDANNLLSMEAGGNEFPITDTSAAVSSYEIDAEDGSLELIDQEGIDNRAGCWLQRSESCVVTTNGNGSLSTLEVDDGELTLKNNSADELGNPIDLYFSDDNKYLYVLGGGRPGIYVYEGVEDCELSRIQVQEMGVPDLDATVNGVVGLALYN